MGSVGFVGMLLIAIGLHYMCKAVDAMYEPELTRQREEMIRQDLRELRNELERCRK